MLFIYSFLVVGAMSAQLLWSIDHKLVLPEKLPAITFRIETPELLMRIDRLADAVNHAVQQSSGSAATVGNEVKSSATHILQECKDVQKNIFVHLKAIPLVLLGCAAAYQALCYVKVGIEKYCAAVDNHDAQQKKRALLQTVAGAGLLGLGIATIIKSDAIVCYFSS